MKGRTNRLSASDVIFRQIKQSSSERDAIKIAFGSGLMHFRSIIFIAAIADSANQDALKPKVGKFGRVTRHSFYESGRFYDNHAKRHRRPLG